MDPQRAQLIAQNNPMAIRAEPEVPRVIVDQDGAMLAGDDGFVPGPRVAETEEDYPAEWMPAIRDAAFETVVHLRFPGRVVEANGILPGGGQMALEAAETLVGQ